MVVNHARNSPSFSLLEAARQFFECGSASFLLAPALHVFQIDPRWLTPADKNCLIEIGAGLPVDVSGKSILHTVGRRKQAKFPALDFDFFRNHWKLLADLHRSSRELEEEMGARRVSEISGFAWLEAQPTQDVLDPIPMEIISDHVEIAGAVKPCGVNGNDRAAHQNRTDSGSFKVPRHKAPKFLLAASGPVRWVHHL